VKRDIFWLFSRLLIVVVILFYLFPIFAVAAASFTLKWNDFGLPVKLGLSGYKAFWDTMEFRRSLWVSLEIAPLNVIITILVVVPATYAVYMSRSKALKSLADIIITIPLCLPALVLAIGLLQSYGDKPLVLTGTIWVMILGHVVLSSPFMYRSVLANLQVIDTKTLVEASKSLGAKSLKTLLRVVLPNIIPGIISGSLLAFTTSFGEFQLARMVSGFMNQTFPVKIWEASRRSTRVQFSMSFIAIVIAMIFFVVIIFSLSKSKIKEEKVIA
jgi:putative spermidine/putrescine transport system permease protein